MNIGIILQARMGSSRLPGKILKNIGSKSLLDHIVHRLGYLKYKVPLVIATTTQSKDDIVEEYCTRNRISCFRGSEANVLERYYECATKYEFDQIVRMTGDNPFPDVEEIGNLIDLHISTSADYSNSFEVLPVGVGAEIFTGAALEKSYREGKEAHHIEHVNEYMLENPDIFKTSILDVPLSKRRPDIRLTVDTTSDYERACCIVERSKSSYISTHEAIRLCMECA